MRKRDVDILNIFAPNTSSFFLLYARPPRYTLYTVFPFYHRDNPTVADNLCLAEKARRLARLLTLVSQENFKARYDARHRPVTYHPGYLAWLWTPTRKRCLRQKPLANYDGPYFVLDMISEVNYALASRTLVDALLGHKWRMSPGWHNHTRHDKPVDSPGRLCPRGEVCCVQMRKSVVDIRKGRKEGRWHCSGHSCF